MDDHYEPGEPGMDPDGLGSDGLDPLSGDGLGGDAHGLGPDGLDPLGGDVLGGDEPPGPDHNGLADLDSADTADLSFADEYGHPFPGDAQADLPEAGHGGHSPIGYGDLSADLPDHLHDMLGAGDAPFGADPDLYPLPDDLGAGPGPDLPFPPTLDLTAPEPVDGYPWADPSALGHEPLPPLDDPATSAGGPGGPGTAGTPQPAELYEYAGESPPADGDAWADLLASPDPATSALARWWSAG